MYFPSGETVGQFSLFPEFTGSPIFISFDHLPSLPLKLMYRSLSPLLSGLFQQETIIYFSFNGLNVNIGTFLLLGVETIKEIITGGKHGTSYGV